MLDALAYSISGKSRAKKWQQFLDLMQPQPDETILDVGVNTIEYSAGDNYLESHYTYPERITALGLEDNFDVLRARYPQVRFMHGDGRSLPFPDQSFAIAYSNAVIEHVGSFPDQLVLLRELVRVAGRGYLTTPNRHFPIEVHTRLPFLHLLLPKQAFDAFLRFIGQGWAAGNYMSLLSRADLERLMHGANLPRPRLIANRFLGFPMTFTLTWDAGERTTNQR